jgi:DNA-binding PadR family transcriptional regulator
MEIYTDEKKMKILAAILKAQSKYGHPATFKDLKLQLEEDETGYSVANSLIYRLISQLEQEDFIKVDRSNYKHTYSSGFTSIHTGLRKAALETMQDINKKIAEIDSEIEFLNNLDVSDFARSTLKIVTGKKRKIKSESVLGIAGFRKLLSKKIFSDCTTHDLLRIAMNDLTLDEVQSICLDFLHKYSKKNKFKIQFLFTKLLSEDQERHMIELIERIKSAGCDADLHAYNHPSSLENFISRNTEGILLLPSDYPFVSVWIPRILNSTLVNETIAKFDIEFSKGIDIM